MYLPTTYRSTVMILIMMQTLTRAKAVSIFQNQCGRFEAEVFIGWKIKKYAENNMTEEKHQSTALGRC